MSGDALDFFDESGCQHTFGMVVQCPTCGAPRSLSTMEPDALARAFFQHLEGGKHRQGNHYSSLTPCRDDCFPVVALIYRRLTEAGDERG
jgi:hypothetical protein